MLHDAVVSRLQGHTHEPASFRHPAEDIDPADPEVIPLEDALHAILFIIAELDGADNARLSGECLAGSVGLNTYKNRSMADIARDHGVTREAVRKRVEKCQIGIGMQIIGAVFQKRSQAGSEYFLCNRRNHKLN